jgi:hypothetical protein
LQQNLCVDESEKTLRHLSCKPGRLLNCQ